MCVLKCSVAFQHIEPRSMFNVFISRLNHQRAVGHVLRLGVFIENFTIFSEDIVNISSRARVLFSTVDL